MLFNIGPMEFLVLAIVAVIVLGPERLPALAKDAARMLRTLRDMATGARQQLRDELGPEFADLGIDELRNLNPRTALQRAILGDEDSGLRSDLRKLDPRDDVRDSLRGADPRRYRYEDDAPYTVEDTPYDDAGSADKPVSMTKPAERPLARGEAVPFDEDAT
jgi:sec-independent protein translocase protein TatB